MRDWPEPDQDTILDILEVWDLGDYEEARAERYYEEIARTEETEVNVSDDNNPYADWEPPHTCACCDTEYCQSMADEAFGRHEDDMYAYAQKSIGEALEEFDIAALNADAAHTRSDILQAKTNIARIKANIAELKSQIAYNNYLSVEGPRMYIDAENQLVNAEADLVEAKTVLANARTRGAAHAAVVAAHNYVKYAEAKVQIKKEAKNSTIEFHSKFLDDEPDSLVENDHIEFVNALIELAEAKDALDLAEMLLAKTPSLSLTHGYRFTNHEPHCPTSYSWNDKLSSINPDYCFTGSEF